MRTLLLIQSVLISAQPLHMLVMKLKIMLIGQNGL